MTKPNLALNTTTPEAASPTIHYELTNHLGNVMAVITDEPAATETPAVESLTDYYPFGMTMPGRSYNAHTSRHGFTGHEKESDLAEGIYTTEYRLYDARVGRWLSVDPLFEKYVGMSPYNYCMLNPAMMVDPDGRSPESQRDRMLPTGESYTNAITGGCTVATAKLLAEHFDRSYSPQIEIDRNNPTHGDYFHKYMDEYTNGLKTEVLRGFYIPNKHGEYDDVSYENDLIDMEYNIKCGNVSYVVTTGGHTKAINNINIYKDKKGRLRCKIQYMENLTGQYETVKYKMKNMTRKKFGNIFKVTPIPLKPEEIKIKDKEIYLKPKDNE